MINKRILITGSSGHSGHQIATLLKDQFEILGVDLVGGQYTNFTGSLTDPTFVDKVCKDVYAVIHTAALHAPHITTHSRRDFIDTNVTGTLNLLEAAAANGAEKFIYTSTTSLYGESMENEEAAVWITEDVPKIPRDIYDITKIAAEGLCRDFFDKQGLQTTVLRVSRFWDEPMKDKIFYRMYRGLDVRDVALAHQLALTHDFERFDIFNISAQSIFTRTDLSALKNNLQPILQDRVPALIEHYHKMGWTIPSSIDRVYVMEKAKEVLGYTPRYNIAELLASLADK